MFINKSAKLLSSKTEMLSFSSCLLHWTLFGGGTTVPATLLLFGTLQRTQCIIILWSQQRPSIEWQTGTNRWFSWWRPMTTSTRMLWEFSFLFRFVFPHENNKTIGANYLTKENGQSILVLVVYDAIMQVAYLILVKLGIISWESRSNLASLESLVNFG